MDEIEENISFVNSPLVVFRFVTRGTSPHLMHWTIENNWKILKPHSFAKIEIVTDIPINIEPESYCIPSDKFDELVVPNNFSTPNNTLFKARALYYASLNSKLTTSTTDNCFIFHCDEESVVTESLLLGIKEYILNPNNINTIGQGLITYRNDEHTLSSYICHCCEAVRVGLDLARYRFQLKLINKIIFSLKGSFILVSNKIEIEHGTSFDCCGEFGSITEDSWWAYTQNIHKNKFNWCNGVLIEQSAFYINDTIKQRRICCYMVEKMWLC
eukprot:235845_1